MLIRNNLIVTQSEKDAFIESLNTINSRWQKSVDLAKRFIDITEKSADGDQINEFIRLTTHTGKLEGLYSISTFKKVCDFCQKASKDKKNICHYCYSDKTTQRYQNMIPNLIINTLILKYYKVDGDQLKVFKTGNNYQILININYLRFESFSDLQSKQHFENLMNIARANESVTFGFWFKNKSLVDFEKIPQNVSPVYSSIQLNKLNKDVQEMINKGCKVFTVYDNETIEKENITINCGGRNCLGCMNCYKKDNNIKFINEKIK